MRWNSATAATTATRTTTARSSSAFSFWTSRGNSGTNTKRYSSSFLWCWFSLVQQQRQTGVAQSSFVSSNTIRKSSSFFSSSSSPRPLSSLRFWSTESSWPLATTTAKSHSLWLRGGSGKGSLFGLTSTSSSSSLSVSTQEQQQSMSTATTTMATKVPSTATAEEKLTALRQRMAQDDLDLYIVPSDDPHLSEYTPDAYRRRGFITNFQGSAGTAVIPSVALAQLIQQNNDDEDGDATSHPAYLWTDSRYWNEANLCLDNDWWTLQKQGIPSTLTIPQWIAQQAKLYYTKQPPPKNKKPLRIGINPFVVSANFIQDVTNALETEAATLASNNDDDDDDDENDPPKIGEIVSPTMSSNNDDDYDDDGKNFVNLVDEIWLDRPALPKSPFRVHPLSYAGFSISEKVNRVRKAMMTSSPPSPSSSSSSTTTNSKQQPSPPATLAVFCTLDDVAYLLNLRAKGDIDTCPVGIAYATVSMDEVCLYCDPAKIEGIAEVQEHLEQVTLRPYDAIVDDIAAHCAASKKHYVWIDKSRSNYAISQVIPPKQLLDGQNAIVPMKACKNRAELQGMRQAHIADGAAMAEFMAWLEDATVNQGRSVSEVEIDERLTGCRAKQPGFVEVSFPTIAGVGSNGAIIHYRADEKSELLQYLDTKNPILIDSGGQYTYGTTDVTRTWHFGTATPEFRDVYTRVLKGNIGLDTMVFPEKTTPGFVLDVMARKWLWEVGRDYGHGTGHGVGAALNVHEGPMSISPRWANKEILKKGMVISNEPGFYADGDFGIRIENLLEVQYMNDDDNQQAEDEMEQPVVVGTEKKNENNNNKASSPSGQKKFLRFSKLTMIPIQKNLINLDLMTKDELDWLDSYHELVLAKVGPLLEPDSPAMAWLTKMCSKIERN